MSAEVGCFYHFLQTPDLSELSGVAPDGDGYRVGRLISLGRLAEDRCKVSINSFMRREMRIRQTMCLEEMKYCLKMLLYYILTILMTVTRRMGWVSDFRWI